MPLKSTAAHLALGDGVFYAAAMRNALLNRLVAIIAYAAMTAILSGAVWWVGYGAALDQLALRGRADLALAADRLTADLQTYRELSVLVADHPVTSRVLEGGTAGNVLSQIADKTGALEIAVVRADGTELANANGEAVNIATSPAFARAMQGALGVDHGFSDRFDKRVFIFAAPVFGTHGPVIGAVVVVADMETVEAAWRGAQEAVFFSDETGVIFMSNRSELVFRDRSAEPQAAAGFENEADAPFVSYRVVRRGSHIVWQIEGQRYLPERGLYLRMQLPTVDLVGEELVDVAPARQIAGLQTAVAVVICLAFGVMLFFVTERRRALAKVNQLLEARVQRRTAELEATNVSLRREIHERTAAEAALKKAQDDLVQAGKLSALGQMSAGISHELNQPLMAIRSFAENAEAFLDRGKPDKAAQNLARISELARRMGRIIRNLRAFSRQESEPLTDVPLAAAIDGTLEMAATKARQEGAEIFWNGLSEDVRVRAGEVRLQQVLLNLISNAIDAMEGQESKPVTLEVERIGGRIALSVRDRGPGIAEPEKIFDPFYTTKQVGSAEGMGLGLSISYGLVQSFGGAIRGRNHPEGGAVFTIELDITQEPQSA